MKIKCIKRKGGILVLGVGDNDEWFCRYKGIFIIMGWVFFIV